MTLKFEIRITVYNEFGVFEKSFPDIYSAIEWMPRAPDLRSVDSRSPAVSPGTVSFGPASIPKSAPAAEVVPIAVKRGESSFTAEHLVRDGSDASRLGLIEAAARAAAGCRDADPTPRFRTFANGALEMTIISYVGDGMEALGISTFTWPKLLREDAIAVS
jgi:hypothetical protein